MALSLQANDGRPQAVLTSDDRRPRIMERDLVFDIGVNNGDDTAHYLRRGFRVVGVDANPAMIASCEQRFAAEIRAGRLVLVNAGLAAEEGVASFFVSEGHRGGGGRFRPRPSPRRRPAPHRGARPPPSPPRA